MIFDTHAHYDDEQFNEDRVELLNSMEEQGVGTIINVSATYNSCRKVIALAKEYPFVYAAQQGRIRTERQCLHWFSLTSQESECHHNPYRAWLQRRQEDNQ